MKRNVSKIFSEACLILRKWILNEREILYDEMVTPVIHHHIAEHEAEHKTLGLGDFGEIFFITIEKQ